MTAAVHFPRDRDGVQIAIGAGMADYQAVITATSPRYWRWSEIVDAATEFTKTVRHDLSGIFVAAIRMSDRLGDAQPAAAAEMVAAVTDPGRVYGHVVVVPWNGSYHDTNPDEGTWAVLAGEEIAHIQAALDHLAQRLARDQAMRLTDRREAARAAVERGYDRDAAVIPGGVDPLEWERARRRERKRGRGHW